MLLQFSKKDSWKKPDLKKQIQRDLETYKVDVSDKEINQIIQSLTVS